MSGGFPRTWYFIIGRDDARMGLTYFHECFRIGARALAILFGCALFASFNF